MKTLHYKDRNIEITMNENCLNIDYKGNINNIDEVQHHLENAEILMNAVGDSLNDLYNRDKESECYHEDNDCDKDDDIVSAVEELGEDMIKQLQKLFPHTNFIGSISKK